MYEDVVVQDVVFHTDAVKDRLTIIRYYRE